MTRNQANAEMVAALRRAGIKDAMAVQHPMAVRTATFGDKGWINVDLMLLDPRRRRDPKIKICMYVNDAGRAYIKKLIQIGQSVRGVALERGNQFNGRQVRGVVYKLNTGIDWRQASKADFDKAAGIARDFKDAVSTVF